MITRAARGYAASYEGLPRAVWLLAAVFLIQRSGTMVFPFLTIYLTQRTGLEPTAVGWLLSACGLGSVVGCYVGGRLTTRFGALPVIFVSQVLCIPAYLAIPYCGSTLAIATALFARHLLGDAMRPAISTATTLLTPPERHAQALALNRLAFNLGCSVGPVIGGVLASIDIDLIFPGTAAFVAASAVAMLVFFRRRVFANDLHPEEEAVDAGEVGPWSDRTFVAFLGLYFVGMVTFFQLVWALPLYWSNQCGIGELSIGVLFAVNTVMIVLLEMPFTRWAERWAPLRLVAIGMLFYGVGFGLTPLADSFASAAVLVVVWTVGEMLSAPFSTAFVASRSGAKRRGQFMGAYATMISAALVASPVVGLWLYDLSPALPWWCALATTCPAGVAMLRLGRRERSRRPIVAAA